MDILTKFRRIIVEESKLNNWIPPDTEEVFNTVEQIKEFATAGTVIRSYNLRYGLSKMPIAYESDGSHSNLMAAIVDRAYHYNRGPYVPFTSDGYTYREIMEAVRRHDLPENITGDIPDNGCRDDAAKRQHEQNFQARFSAKAPPSHTFAERRIKQLLSEMDAKSSPTGRLIYVADKISAIIMVLCYESMGYPPLLSLGDAKLSDRDKTEMDICDITINDSCLASEMWTIDYLKARHLVDYDEDGFLTAILIMYTLQVHEHWYSWREAEYSTHYTK